MKVGVILGVVLAFVLLVVLTLFNSGDKLDVLETPVPKKLPKVALGGVGPDGAADLKENEEDKAEEKRIAELRDAKISEGVDLQRLAIPTVAVGAPGKTIAPPRCETNFDAVPGLDQDDLVVGLISESKSRAYLVKQLAVPGQSVVNDVFNARRIVLTWNNANRTAVAFAGQANGLNLSFRTAAKSWKSDLLFQDKETESIWSQVMGVCIEGQLQGSTLDALPCTVTTWGHWKKSCPATELIVLDETAESTEPYTGKFSSANPKVNSIAVVFADGKFEVVDRKKLIGDRVINTSVGQHAVVLFYNDAADTTHGFRSAVGLQALTFDWRGTIFVEHGTDTVWDINTGHATDGLMAQAKLTPIIVIETTAELWAATRSK